jgi:hypothetical protein
MAGHSRGNGFIFEGMQGFCDLYRQKMLAIQGHNLTDFYHTAFQLTELLHQIYGFTRQRLTSPGFTIYLAGEQVGSH